MVSRARDIPEALSQVKEFSVAELRLILTKIAEDGEKKKSNPEKFDLLGEILLDGTTFTELSFLSGLPVSVMNSVVPSELQGLYSAICEANPRWESCRSKLIEAGKVLMANNE
jgi:hypothetical protein